MKILLTIFILLISSILYSKHCNAETNYDNAIHFGLSYGVGNGLNHYVLDDYRYSMTGCVGAGIAYDYYRDEEFNHQYAVANVLGCGLGVFVSEYFKTDNISIDVDDDGFMLSFVYEM